MLGHLGLNVSDLRAAKVYYDEIMPMLGYTDFFSTDDQVAYRPAHSKPGTYLFLYPAIEVGAYSRHGPGLQHLAFMVKTRSQVIDVFRRVSGMGSIVLHEPRDFPDYPPPYFATFWLDPFGFMLEAVCHHDEN